MTKKKSDVVAVKNLTRMSIEIDGKNIRPFKVDGDAVEMGLSEWRAALLKTPELHTLVINGQLMAKSL